MVIFMLLERRDLRDRLIGLFGHGRLAVTTKAFDEAGTRVSRQLLMQSLVNLVYGIAAGVGLYFLGVPYALVWAALGAALRFIPYVGPVLGAGAPILVSLAALQGWTRPLEVVGLFVGLELVHESRARNRAVCRGGRRLAGRAAGVRGVLDVALGTARPAHGDTADRVPRRAWQARSRSRVRRDADGRYSRARPRVRLLPAPAGARSGRSRRPHRAAHQDRAAALGLRRPAAAGAQLCRARPPGGAAVGGRRNGRHRCDAGAACRRRGVDPAPASGAAASARRFTGPPGPREPLRVLGYATNGVADELALAMLAHLLDDLPIAVDITAARMQASELVSLVREREFSVVCFADLPPSPPSKTRYLVKRLRAALPEVRILVGRWAPPALADESTQVLRETGANHVALDAGGDDGNTWAGSWKSRGFRRRRHPACTRPSSRPSAGRTLERCGRRIFDRTALTTASHRGAMKGNDRGSAPPPTRSCRSSIVLARCKRVFATPDPRSEARPPSRPCSSPRFPSAHTPGDGCWQVVDRSLQQAS